MGTSYNAICKKCGTKYQISSGGGFIFHKLHCDQCGMEKDISFMELGDLHKRYLKGLKVPYCMATANHDKFVQENYNGEIISEEQYHKEIEIYAGKCDCGGIINLKLRQDAQNADLLKLSQTLTRVL
ncbi:MAG TPA: hypothetical protein PKH80_05820 [Methanofastidiosum sp.]|nr:hypothetical protein [Methanofastidiosum sp.]HNU61545.1 hypothetical protein [Methanofastidiosum sp.]